VSGECKKSVFVGRLHVGDPVLRYAHGKKVFGPEFFEQPDCRPAGRRRANRHFNRHAEVDCALGGRSCYDLLDSLAYLNDLHSPGLWMGLDASPLGPAVGVVVVPDIGEQQACTGLVHDDADVAADAHRPEVRILRLVDAVKLQTRPVRLGLQVVDRQLRLLLLVARQMAKRGGEGIGEDSRHQSAR
jgi:hypothetical protein